MSLLFRAFSSCILVLLLSACQPTSDTTAQQPPVAFQAADECHVCGMLITHHPGPKGEAYQQGQPKVLKFCSTRDLFVHLLEPGVAAQIESIYVHDMARSDWQHPDDRHLINAREAWYVVGHPLHGAMGPSPAAFATEAQANAFAKPHQASVLRYAQITLQHLQ